MSNIAIVKLFKDMLGKLFGTEERNEKVSLINEVEKPLEAKKPLTEEVKKTSAKKKEPEKKKTTTTKKKTIPQKTSEKKKTNTTTKAKAAPKGTKKAEKIALYTKAFKKQYGDVDTQFLEIIVKNLGPSIYKKDAELVSCSDPKELDTVRKNFLIKKLGIEEDKETLDTAIKEVCEELKGTSKKYRALFYYRLAQKFKKESVLH